MRRSHGETYAVGGPAETLLIRIRQALEAGEPALTAWAWREYGTRDVRDLERRRIEAEDELNEVVKLGAIDIELTGKPQGWTLHLSVADELGDHLPDDADTVEGPEEIDVAQFWKEFTRFGPDTLLAEVSANSAAAKQRFDRFLKELVSLYG